MKPVSPALTALLRQRSFQSADLFSFAPVGGGGVALTNADVPVSWNGVTFACAGPLIQRSKFSQKTGLDVSQMVLTILPKPTDLLLGEPWLKALRQGLLDGANVQVNRAFWPATGYAPGVTIPNATGTVELMNGRVGDVKIGRSQATLDVNAWTELLKINLPRNYYQSPCGHTLYDVGCGVNPDAFAIEAEVGAGPTANAFLANGLAGFAAGFFAQGYLRFLSGANAGQRRSVISSGGAAADGTSPVQLMQPLPNVAAVGDTFMIYAGCDKTRTTCQAKFNNLARYRGFPWIPDPTTAV